MPARLVPGRMVAAALLVALFTTMLLTGPTATGATRPPAPAACSATPVPGSPDHRVRWQRPAGHPAPIWRYVVKVEGQPRPVVQLSSRSKDVDSRRQAYRWSARLPDAGAPVFLVRAVNRSGFGRWCRATPAGSAPRTEPAPGPAPAPGTAPAPETTPPAGTAPTPETTPAPATEPAPEPAPGTAPAPGTPAPETTPGDQPFIAYGPDSFFRSRLDGAPVDEALTTRFRAFMKTHPDQRNVAHPRLIGMEGNKWGMVFDLADCSDPVWRIGEVSGRTPAEWVSLRTVGFHADAALAERFTGTDDSPFVVIDRCTGISVWAANAAHAGGTTIDVSTFGAFRHDSNGLDKRNPRATSAQSFRSRGVIPDSMLVRKDLMDHAKAHGTDLGHVLEIFFVETDSSAGHVHPMVGSESGKRGFGAEGTRIAVAPDVDLTARPCSPEALVVARTLQRYGGYLGDNSGSTTNIKVEQEATPGAVWGGVLHRDELAGCISWDDFVVITPGWQ